MLVGCVLVAGGLALIGAESGLFSVLSSQVHVGRQEQGFYLLPTNQLLHPWGEQAAIKGPPVDLAFDSRKHLLAVLNSRNVLLLDGASGAQMAASKSRATSYTGIAFRPGDRELWASEATENGPDSLLIVTLSEMGAVVKAERVTQRRHPLPAGIDFSADGKTAFVAFNRSNTLAVFDTEMRQLTREVPVGMAPFGVAVSQTRVFVTNRGGRRPAPADTVAPSSGSMIATDKTTGSSVSGTVTAINTDDFSTREVEVGLAPSGIAISPDEKMLAVANAHSDSISLVDAGTLSVTGIKIDTWPEGTLGSQPVAVAFAPDGHTVYVACGGNNAIAVVRAEGGGWKLAGALPTGWFPSGVTVDGDGALRIINIKGVGNTAAKNGAFNSLQYEGSLARMPAPADAQIAAGTREVREANSPRFAPAGGIANLPSLGIRHVFFIIKENRTYDQVFGDIARGNGDPKLCVYGREVTPNQHALAERYVLLDNFHTGGAISFDGHQWLMQAFVSDYVERALAASPRGYAWNMTDAMTVAPTGFFWQAAPKPLNVRIYGEFCLPAKWDPATQSAIDITEHDLMSWGAYWELYKQGKWQDSTGSRSGVPALEKYVDQRYPAPSTGIPDEMRAEEFTRELGQFEKTGTLPNLVVMVLNNDHTDGTRPGSPTPRAMVANNDIALGRVVEAISKSKFWSKSLILVVEDDAQNGLDHVDGHRTVALAIGPHVRRGAVDSNNYNQTSMVRTIQEIFDIPAKTRYLVAARAMHSIFAADADISAYTALTPKQPLDEMNPGLSSLDGRRLWAAQQSLAMNWSHPDDIREDALNPILWWAAKGYDKPYPSLHPNKK